jgi:hypothetical protein
MSQPTDVEDVTEEIVANIPSTDEATREVAQIFAEMIGDDPAENCRAVIVYLAYRNMTPDQMAQAFASAIALLVDEQAAHAKTCSNFQEYADSRGDGLLRTSVEGLEKLVEDRDQSIGKLAYDLIQTKAQLHAAEKRAAEHTRRHTAIFDAHLRQVAQLTDERDAALATTERNRLAWVSAHRRAASYYDEMIDARNERDALRAALKAAWPAGSVKP